LLNKSVMRKMGHFMGDSLLKITAKSSGPDHNIRAEALWIGPDLLVYIWGGDAPHIGAVAMAQPRPSLADPKVTSSTASVFTYVGHKEDDLAKWAAEKISAALGSQGGGHRGHPLGRPGPGGHQDRAGQQRAIGATAYRSA
jgi:hypothetical protein